MNLVAQGFTCANSRSFWSISDSEGSDVPEASTPDTRANRLELAGSSICDGMFLRRLEGPGTPVTGPISAIGYPILTCVLVLFRYLRRCRPQ